MKRANHDTFIAYNFKDNVIIGLGYAYCAEHECGINGIRKAFGINVRNNKIGIDKRKITKLPPYGFYIKDNAEEVARIGIVDDCKATAIFYVPHSVHKDYQMPYELEWMPSDGNDNSLVAAWNSESFGIKAYKEEEREALRELYQAFLRNDVVIYLARFDSPFGSQGLNIRIASQIPEIIVKQMERYDIQE